jgi:hypothetical protein
VPGKARSKAQRLKDRETIARLRLRSRTLVQIVQETGLSKATVCRELNIIEADWQAAALEAIDKVKARELQKLDHLEQETFEQWERSKQDAVKRVVEKGKGKGGGSTSKLETAGQCGDPRYLNVLLGIHERRAKILGSDAPTKIAPTNPDGTELLSKEHRDAIVAAALGAAGSDP